MKQIGNKKRIVLRMLSVIMVIFVVLGLGSTLPVVAQSSSSEELVSEHYLGTKTDAKVYDDFENDIWLPFEQKELEIGESVSVYPRRVPQIITNPMDNDVVRPVFSYTILKGADVISFDDASAVTQKKDDVAAQSKEEVEITAQKAGTAIVAVTYDATKDNKENVIGAISPCNTGYFAITVGEDGSDTPQIKWDSKLCSYNEPDGEKKEWSSYDTIYYAQGDTVAFPFSVACNESSLVSVLLNGIELTAEKEELKEVEAKNQKELNYNALLENRSNILAVTVIDSNGKKKTVYHMIDARKIDVSIKNESNEQEKTHIYAGDDVVISFRGITMPVYKLAGIYNPTFYSARFGSPGTSVVYTASQDIGLVQGRCEQWDLADNNEIKLQTKSEGTLTLDCGYIATSWWGRELGADKEGKIISPAKKDANGNVPLYEWNASVLPVLQLDVEPAKKQETTSTNSEQDNTKRESTANTKDSNVSVTTQQDKNTVNESLATSKTSTAEALNRESSDTSNTPSTQETVQPKSLKIQRTIKIKKIKVQRDKKKKVLSIQFSKIKNSLGYEVQISTSKLFSKKKTKTMIISPSQSKFIYKKIKVNRTYYIRVRSLLKKDRKKVYSAYSKVIKNS